MPMDVPDGTEVTVRDEIAQGAAGGPLPTPPMVYLSTANPTKQRFNMVKAQLKGFRAFVARVKADPKSVMEQLGEQEEEDNDDSDDEY